MAKPKKKSNKAKGKKPARKPFVAPVNTKTGKADAAPARSESTVSVTPGTTLKSLLSTCRGLKANSDSIISKMREEIGYAVEKKHLDKGVFAELRRYDKMEPEKAAERWHMLVRYMELSGVMAKIESVGRLPLGDQDNEEVEEEAETRAPKAAKPRKGNGKSVVEAIKETPEGGEAEADADTVAAEANSEALRNGIKPAAPAVDVTKPHFGQAPGGSVHMMPDRKAAH